MRSLIGQRVGFARLPAPGPKRCGIVPGRCADAPRSRHYDAAVMLTRMLARDRLGCLFIAFSAPLMAIGAVLVTIGARVGWLFLVAGLGLSSVAAVRGLLKVLTTPNPPASGYGSADRSDGRPGV